MPNDTVATNNDVAQGLPPSHGSCGSEGAATAATVVSKGLPSCNRLGCDCSDRRQMFKRIIAGAMEAHLHGTERDDIILLNAEVQWFGGDGNDDL